MATSNCEGKFSRAFWDCFYPGIDLCLDEVGDRFFVEAFTKSIFKNYKPCVKVDKFSLSLNKNLGSYVSEGQS